VVDLNADLFTPYTVKDAARINPKYKVSNN